MKRQPPSFQTPPLDTTADAAPAASGPPPWEGPSSEWWLEPTTLETPGGDPTPPSASQGRYQLLRQIGEGGFGEVWLARQDDELCRQVAVKMLKPGLDSRTVLSRFNAERQVLAMLEHPNIARVHDAGMTPEGRPFFVMEFVDGPPLTRYCDLRRLTVRERVRLLLEVCEAIHHAHQRAVLHRDLKPANILVRHDDSAPRIKIIDFGIAKALALQSTGHSLWTQHGEVMGPRTI